MESNSRIEQIFVNLGYSRENGLFYLSEAETWISKFPYRISKILRDVIRPYAFFSLHHEGSVNSLHPEPINNPIILFFDKPSAEKRNEIPKWSFCFGQAPIVIINNSDFDPIEVYHGYRFEADHIYKLQSLNVDYMDFSLFNLTIGKTWKSLFETHFKNVPKVDKYLLSNIIDARRILIADDGLGLVPKIANRLIGRLLFIRYLIDRRVVFDDQRFISGESKADRQTSLNTLIQDKEQLYKFFTYLTDKFQGDLFPLYLEKVNEHTGEVLQYAEESFVNQAHLDILYHLFSCSSLFYSGIYKGYVIQPSMFMVYDFEVIPVELISNIYENFIGKEEENTKVELGEFYKKSKQYDLKAYYTPPFIVDYVLSQTVAPFLSKSNTADCKVLDPACGSGIFLVETLRKIIEKSIKLSAHDMLSDKDLWKLLTDNIFGIDIDEDAIEITVFSLYITLLDFKKPAEIESFKFEKLKGYNLFGGASADFFNVESSFEHLFKNEVQLDFILGNPPWGKVSSSRYIEYVKDRRLSELKSQQITGQKNVQLEIGNKEISQAFLVRVSDFAIPNKTNFAFIVTGKCIYNTDSTTKQWRSYFLQNFSVSQVFELSNVNNKNSGGNQIFEEARQPAAVIFYQYTPTIELILSNILTHITVRANRFFNYFRTIVIEKHDVKKVAQRKFLENYGGNDYLWKILVHGNVLDVYFVQRLKGYDTLSVVMDSNDLEISGGLKLKDGNKKVSTENLAGFKYLDIGKKKEFQPYQTLASNTWKKHLSSVKNSPGPSGDVVEDTFFDVGYLPDSRFFMGEKALIKKGLKEDFMAVSAYSNENIVFTDSVAAIRSKHYATSDLANEILKSIPAIINSKLFSYYILHTGASAGIDRTRAYFDEFLSAPFRNSSELAKLVEKFQSIAKETNGKILQDLSSTRELKTIYWKIEGEVMRLFEITDLEKDLIEYSSMVSIPVFKRAEESSYGTNSIFQPLESDRESYDYLERYIDVFVEHFRHRFNTPDKMFYCNAHIGKEFIACHFIVGPLPASENIYYNNVEDGNSFLTEMGIMGIHQLSKDLYIQQDVRGFSKNTFYIIKPNEVKAWHRAVAQHDLIEFIEALTKAELQTYKLT